MTTAADLAAKLTAIKTGLDAVAADIARIKGSISGGLTAAEADAVNAELDAVLARVTGIDAETPEG